MKDSKYNIFTQTHKGVICFNTYKESYLFLSNDAYQQIKNENYTALNPKTYKILMENGFLITDEKDEFNELTEEYENAITNTIYHLTLLPSLDCNLRCWYCFEKHIKGSRLSSEIQEAIFQHVVSIFESKHIEHLKVELFGGEPLLYFKEELFPLLDRIKKYVEKINKDVTFFFVTNAVCITDDMLPLFKSLNAIFQISIDGYREKHNKVKRNHEGIKDTYGKVIDIIHKLTQYYDTHINLRINYDDQTLEHIEDVIKDIVDIDRRQLGIHLERVWQTQRNSKENKSSIKDYY